MRRRLSRVVVSLIALAATLALPAVGARATFASAAGAEFQPLGQLSAPHCSNGGVVAHPSQPLLLNFFVQDGNCSSNTTVGKGIYLQLVRESGLKTVSTLPVLLPGYDLTRGFADRIGAVRAARTPHGDRLFVYYNGVAAQNSQAVAPYVSVFDLTGIANRRSQLRPERTINVPAAIPPSNSTISTDDPTEALSSEAAAAAGLYPPEADDLSYDETSDSIDLVQSYGNVGGGSPQTSSRGPFAAGVYALEFAASTGTLRWAVHLGRCAFILNGVRYAQTLMHVQTSAGPVVAGGCLYTRSVPTGSNSQNGSITLPTGGSMLAWSIRLGNDKSLANAAAPVSYFLGRTASSGVVADPQDRRLFFTALPPSGTTGANAAGAAAVVFDADHSAYVGAPTVAAPNEGSYTLVVGSHRYYSLGRHGVIVGGATGTPLGQPNPSWHGFACNTAEAVVDPRTRLIFVRPGAGCGPGNPGNTNAGSAGFFEVYRDQVALPAPAAAVDPDSYTSVVPAGIPTEISYDGHGEATGTRARLIGGVTGFEKGATFDGYDIGEEVLDEANQASGGKTPRTPNDVSTREITAGVVSGVNLGSFEASAQAVPATADDTSGSQVQDRTGKTWPFKEEHCSGQESPPRSSYGAHTGATVVCDQQGQQVSATSDGEALDLATTLAGAGVPAQPLDIGVLWSSADATAVRGDAGLVTEVTAEARGIVVGPVRIGDVRATAKCSAAGTPHTASCSYTRSISGVHGLSSGDPTSCVQVWDQHRTPAGTDCDELINAINRIEPGFLIVSAPAPDTDSGQLVGSPGGYQGIAERNFYDQLQDGVLNYDDSKQIPGLRVLYVNDSVDAPSRLDVQFASVEAESHFGISPGGCVGCGGDGPHGPLGGTNPTSVLTAPPPPTVVAPPTPADHGGPFDGAVQLVRRVLSGLSWLLRSPGQTALVGCVLALLAAPLLLARRRQRLEHLTASG